MATFDPVWEEIFASSAWGKYPQEHVIRFVARRFYQAADRSAVRILDLGSGPGATAWFLAREGFSVAAIDGSASAIDQLKARLASEGKTVDAKVGDIAKLPWADGTFDAVIDNFAICHNPMSAAQEIMADIKRVLRPGGALLSGSFTDRTWGYGTGRPMGSGAFRDVEVGNLKARGFVHFRGRAEIEQLFSDFMSHELELYSFTMAGMRELTEMWIATGVK